VDDHTSASGVKRYMLGGEPIVARDGSPLTDREGRRSFVTSAGSGPSLGKHILLSYLPPEHAVVGEQLAVEYMNERYPVTVERTDSMPLFDPDNERVKAAHPVLT
jgi:glycine cleavage system aminomethyltransferase T